MEATRCSGHCCKRFYIGLTWTEINENWSSYPDGAQIRDMLIPLPDPSLAELQESLDGEHYQVSSGHFYTCKNHDVVTGDCKVYETRPGMCRNYPNDMHCQFKACEMAEVFARKLAEQRENVRKYMPVAEFVTPYSDLDVEAVQLTLENPDVLANDNDTRAGNVADGT